MSGEGVARATPHASGDEQDNQFEQHIDESTEEQEAAGDSAFAEGDVGAGWNTRFRCCGGASGIAWADVGHENCEEDVDSAATILAHCRERLSGYQIPRAVDFDPQLPRTEAGKLARRSIRARYWQGRERRV